MTAFQSLEKRILIYILRSELLFQADWPNYWNIIPLKDFSDLER